MLTVNGKAWELRGSITGQDLAYRLFDQNALAGSGVPRPVPWLWRPAWAGASGLMVQLFGLFAFLSQLLRLHAANESRCFTPLLLGSREQRDSLTPTLGSPIWGFEEGSKGATPLEPMAQVLLSRPCLRDPGTRRHVLRCCR